MPNTKQTRRIGPDAGSATYVSSFSPVLGGSYYNGVSRNETDRGYWWSSTASNIISRYFLAYDDSNLYTDYYRRYNGYYIRCVSEEKDVSDLTYMQDMTAKVVKYKIPHIIFANATIFKL